MPRTVTARVGGLLLSAALLSALGVASLAVDACDSGGTECICPPSGLIVSIPVSLVEQGVEIMPSGAACAGATVDPPPGPTVHAAVYHVEPTMPGPCHLDVLLGDGTTFSDDVTVVESTGCCAGLRTSPPGAAAIDVPSSSDGGS